MFDLFKFVFYLLSGYESKKNIQNYLFLYQNEKVRIHQTLLIIFKMSYFDFLLDMSASSKSNISEIKLAWKILNWYFWYFLIFLTAESYFAYIFTHKGKILEKNTSPSHSWFLWLATNWNFIEYIFERGEGVL